MPIPSSSRVTADLSDLRAEFWGGSEWYVALEKPRDDVPSAWWLAKGESTSWSATIANVGLAYGVRCGLSESFRNRFQAIPASDVTYERALAERRSPSFPIWEILSELVAAAFIDGTLGWKYGSHEPPGHLLKRGDWEFVTPEGVTVFIEVKSLGEWVSGDGVGFRPSYSSRLSSLLKRAYRQLPKDRPTLVVVVGTNSEILRMPTGLLHSELFQAFFGRTIGRMTLDGDQASNLRIGPSFRDMFVHRSKHSRLGAAIALNLRGVDDPLPELYGVQNPFARPESALPPSALAPLTRLVVEDGEGAIVSGSSPKQIWAQMLRAHVWRT